VPGVFAAGDVRYGSVKRVAGDVGEGSVTQWAPSTDTFPPSGRERLGGPHRHDDIADCMADCGGMSFV
jgi:hypothetical protein